MIISVLNQKGGACKTTTAQALFNGLNVAGYNCLIIDLDAQSNLSFALNTSSDKSILNAFNNEVNINDLIVHSEQGDIIPATRNLYNTDKALEGIIGKEYKLKEHLKNLKTQYDFIILDNPPSLNTMTLNALTACDKVIIPLQADILALQGLTQLLNTVDEIKRYTNANIEVAGIVMTKFKGRLRLTQAIMEQVKGIAAATNTPIFNTTIRESTTIPLLQAQNMPIIAEGKNTNNAINDYKELVKELINKLKGI